MITSDDIDAVQLSTVYDRDNHKIGDVGQVFVDDSTGTPTWITVHTGLFGLSESFVPLIGARLDGERVHVAHTEAVIQDAPHTSGDWALTAEEEATLCAYYSGASAAGVAGVAGVAQPRTQRTVNSGRGGISVATVPIDLVQLAPAQPPTTVGDAGAAPTEAAVHER